MLTTGYDDLTHFTYRLSGYHGGDLVDSIFFAQCLSVMFGFVKLSAKLPKDTKEKRKSVQIIMYIYIIICYLCVFVRVNACVYTCVDL